MKNKKSFVNFLVGGVLTIMLWITISKYFLSVCLYFFFMSTIAYSVDWKQLGELPESGKFGTTRYYVDVDSLKIDGKIRSVWLKSVFSKPQSYQGQTYTDLLSFVYYNCSEKSQAVTQVDVYSSDGKLVGSAKRDVAYVPIADGSSDENMYKLVCNFKK